jgi:hypothetical protein
MADVQNIDDFKVDYNGTSYSLLTVPAENSPVVQEQTGKILVNLKLDEIVAGLAKSDDLLRCAYNGVAGKGSLRAAVLGLQHDLKDACDETMLALADFERGSRDVLANMNGMFRFLVQPGKTGLALNYFARCSTAAKSLADRASGLAERFHDLSGKTVNTAKDTEKEKGLSEDQQRAFETQTGELNAKIAEADTKSRELTKRCADLQTQYESAHSDAEKEADRAFAIGMVGAIMKPLAAGLGSAAAAYGASRTGGLSALLAPAPKTDGGSDEKESGSGDGDTSSGDSSPEKSSTDPAAKPKSDSTAGKQAALDGGAAAAKEGADALGKESDKSDERAKSARDLEMQILKMQQEMQTARIEQASLLAKFAVELTNVKDATKITAATVYSLYIAIGALKKVANVLDDAGMFWRQMEKFCSALNSAGFQADVAMLKDAPNDMIDMFRSDVPTKQNVVIYYASWLAIAVVTKQYQTAANNVRETMKKHFEENLNTQDSMALARELGGKLSIDAQKDIDEATASRDAIAKQLTDNQKAAA